MIAQLEQLIAEVKASGPVAAENARLDVSTHAKSGHEYARLRNGTQLSACGRVGSEKHLEVLASLQRREQIAQLTQAIGALRRAAEMPVTVSESVKALEIAPVSLHQFPRQPPISPR